ncbi:MAG TPA: glycerophosphodiester phosphodiesterase family protein [Candidatus Bathyarchaeia archaeon]
MVLRIGHRGAAGYESENTLRGFERAVQLGADMVELDVHLCASGELVVIHDDTVDRTTDGSGSVGGMTLGELRALDAGKGEKIPTLDEVFAALQGRVAVDVELKGLGTAEPVYELVDGLVRRRRWALSKVLVTSFDWGMLEELRGLSDRIRLGSLIHREPFRALRFASEIRAYSVNPFHESMDAGYVREAHRLGLAVYPWTVNEAADIERVKGLGVDGVISDYPDRV